MGWFRTTRTWLEWAEHAKLIFDVVVAILSWKLVKKLLAYVPHISSDWASIVGLLFAAGVLFLLVKLQQRGQQRQESGVQSVATTALTTGASAVDIRKALSESYNSVLQAEFETSFHTAISAYPQSEREPTLIKVIATGLISYMYYKTWWSIYKSQLLALQALNGGIMRREQVKAYYDAAVMQYPVQYRNYSFEEWISYMKGQVLILDQPGDTIGITVRGKDFLKLRGALRISS